MIRVIRGKKESDPISIAEFRPAFCQLRLQPGHDARVHLADARFAQIERGADLLHRHVLVVVEDDDEAFVAIQAARDQAHQVAVLQTVRRVFGLLVFEDVDFAHVLVTVGLVPFLVETDEADRRRLADVFGEVLRAGRPVWRPVRRAAAAGPAPLPASCGPLPSSLPCERTSRGTQSIVRSSSSMAPANARHAIGLELHAAIQIEGIDGVHQAEHAGADEIVQFHPVGQPGPDPLGIVFDERQIPFHQPVAQVLPSVGTDSPARAVRLHPRPPETPFGFLPDERR